MHSNELIRLGASETARLIRSGDLAPIEVIDAHITQIERVNPTINALVSVSFDKAREEARRIGEQLRQRTSASLPLLGVPVTVKDALAVAGLRFTAGSTFYRDNIAGTDAEAVRRLKAAGAIVLGKTSCPDMSSSMETTNLIVGLTRNPWKPGHSAGGSSGGEAALIASGGSPLGLGTDVGGSIRIPAAFCGVLGLKPTGGRVSTKGQIPEMPRPLTEWNTVGPIARRVPDIALALSVLSSTPTVDYRSIDLRSRRLLLPRFLLSQPVSREVAGAVETAGVVLRNVGMIEERVSLPLMKVALEYGGFLYQEWFRPFRAALGGGQPIRLRDELLARRRGKPRLSGAALTVLATFSLFGPMLRVLGYGRLERIKRLRGLILQSMGPGSLMLWPVFPTTAPKHGFAWNPNKGPNYTLIFNCLGFPALAMPVGLTKDGLPLSVQIIGQPNEDETVLAAAAELEKSLAGCTLAPLF
jgi:Asp-tRNA(Asn)/Glu-tRNA(Gln) amidotransferase A subunit family amidase